jgi:hypothetical protein
MDLSVFPDILAILGGTFAVAGAALIAYGGIKAAVKILLLELGKREYVYTKIRNEFTSKIVFGLEFLIAADILKNPPYPFPAGDHQPRRCCGYQDDPRVFPPAGGQGFQSRGLGEKSLCHSEYR